MRLLLALVAAALLARGAVIQGMVVEYGSGLPLSRSRVTLDAVDSTGVHRVKSVLTGRQGAFTFTDLPTGRYLLSASRATYTTAWYGQRRPEGFGQLLELTADNAPHIELRLHKLGVITGTLKDENGVGLPNMSVTAYGTRRPFRPLTTSPTDDRGQFRLFGLPPGPYFIRSNAAQTEDGQTWVPAFAPGNTEIRDARRFDARLDAETSYADLRAQPGQLASVSGTVVCADPHPVNVTLSSDTGRRSATIGCNGAFAFTTLPPGHYELSVLGGQGRHGAYQDIFVNTDEKPANIGTTEFRPTRIEPSTTGYQGTLLIRRRDPAAPGEPFEAKLGTELRLAPGHWEIAARFDDRHWLSSVQSTYDRYRNVGELDPDWFVAYVPNAGGGRIVAQVNDNAGGINGTVTHESNPAPGKLVFLVPLSAANLRSLNGPRQTITDLQGRFHFGGLPPGDYRLLSSDDISSPHDPAISGPATRIVSLSAGATQDVSLPLYRVP